MGNYAKALECCLLDDHNDPDKDIIHDLVSIVLRKRDHGFQDLTRAKYKSFQSVTNVLELRILHKHLIQGHNRSDSWQLSCLALTEEEEESSKRRQQDKGDERDRGGDINSPDAIFLRDICLRSTTS